MLFKNLFYNTIATDPNNSWDVSWDGSTSVLPAGITLTSPKNGSTYCSIAKDSTSGSYYFSTSENGKEADIAIKDGISANAELEVDFIASTFNISSIWWFGIVLRPNINNRAFFYLDKNTDIGICVNATVDAKYKLLVNTKYTLNIKRAADTYEYTLNGTKIFSSPNTTADDSTSRLTRVWICNSAIKVLGIKYRKLS